MESSRLIAGLARMVRDVGLAEDLAQDALLAALEQWPSSGVPDNPGAWLMTAAKRRSIDQLRRRAMLERKHDQLGHELKSLQEATAPDLDAAIDDHIGDDMLRLMFAACHPLLSTEARVTLTLRLVAGLTTDEIARAFLVPEPTIAQRIVRAKRTLADARVPFEVPRGADFDARLASVLQAIYLVFNEGYSATAGDEWLRPALCEDALRLGRILAGLAPVEPEAHGLVALMELQASRSAARRTPGGTPVLLLDRDRARWDRLLVTRGLAALERAESLGELAVELRDAMPVRLGGGAGARVTRRDRRLQRVRAADLAQRLGARQRRETAVDEQLVPPRPVLIEQQHRLAVGRDARRGP